MSKSGVIVLDKLMVQAPVWLSLSGTAIKVYLLFRCKCQFAKRSRRPTKRSEGLMGLILNNGEIVFTYEEAKQKYGIFYSAFRNAIDELREKGFIDITKSGAGLYKSANLYSISQRWRLYGTLEYEKPKPRPQGPLNKGFRKGNQYGRNCKKENSTVTVQHSPTVIEQHSKAEKGKSNVGIIT